MTNEQISKLVDEARIGFSCWEDVEAAPSSATDMIQDLCTAIEVLQKRLEKCKEQRDLMSLNYYISEYGLAGTMIDKYGKEFDEIGSGE